MTEALQTRKEDCQHSIQPIHIAEAGVSCSEKAPEQPRPMHGCPKPQPQPCCSLAGWPAAQQTHLSDTPLVRGEGPVPRSSHLCWGQKDACLLPHSAYSTEPGELGREKLSP